MTSYIRRCVRDIFTRLILGNWPRYTSFEKKLSIADIPYQA
jgi:hypothetical protein